MLCSTTPQAAEVAIVAHEFLPSVIQLSDALDSYGITNDIVLIKDQKTITQERFKAAVIVGLPALETWNDNKVPAIGVSISRVMMLTHKQKLVSGIFWTPPLSRQVYLAKAILGDDKRLGILVDKKSRWKPYGLSAEFMQKNKVSVYFTEDYSSYMRALQHLLDENDALIGIFDTDLYSSANLKNILISAYRLNRPLIGPSSAYLNSGALATTYSSHENTARRLYEILQAGLKRGEWPAMASNPYFSVGYNRQVGRSLNLELPDAEALAAQLYTLEQAKAK